MIDSDDNISLKTEDKDIDNQAINEELDREINQYTSQKSELDDKNQTLDIKLKEHWSLIICIVFGFFILVQLIYSIAFIFSDLGYSEQSKVKIVMLLMGSNFVEVLGLVALILKYLFSNTKPK